MVKRKGTQKFSDLDRAITFSCIEKNGAMSDVYSQIKGMLYRQEIVPGQKIIYRDLAKAFHMSTTPIINALSRLQQDGLVVLKYNT